MKIGIIDYGMGNLLSVSNALRHLGADCFISSDLTQLNQADKLILPGVGAFKDAIDLIRQQGIEQLIQKAIEQEKPILGICLGMQLMFDSSSEFGQHKGLSLLPGDIVKFNTDFKVPHMGWNQLKITKQSKLFMGLPEESYVYFVHSYHLTTQEDVVTATTEYDGQIQVAAEKGQVYALQFHPEKSGEVGLKILDNFIKV